MNLRAVAVAAVILAPAGLLRVAGEVGAGDVVVMPTSARRMREKKLSAPFVLAPSRL
jgi:hypothetical protein